MEQYNSIQQIMKKENGHDRKPIYPSTVIQAVFDAKTGASLEAILAQFNSIYVQYQGSPQATRNIIPVEMRRAGLMITYMNMDSETITEKASSAVQKDNDHWGLDVNWSRVDELSLSGDIAVSANGTWIINGVDTKVPARGSKGDTGLTPWLKTIDNKLHFSYDNTTWEPCSDYLAHWFRVENNKLQISKDNKTWEDVSDYIASYFRFNVTSRDSQAGTIGKIQISRDNKTWQDLSPEFRNYLRIQGYVASTSALPKNQVVGTIYGVNEGTNTYSLHVWDGSTWVNNGTFTSIAAGVVQETGDSETEVMSQKAVSEKLAELGSKVVRLDDETHIGIRNTILEKTIDDCYIINNGSIINAAGYKVYIYSLKKDIDYIIQGDTQVSGAIYAIYEDLDLTSILKIGDTVKYTDGKIHVEKVIRVEVDCFLAVTANDNYTIEVFDADTLKNYTSDFSKKTIDEIVRLSSDSEKIDDTVKAIRTEIESIEYSERRASYVDEGGILRISSGVTSGYHCNIYNISSDVIVEIKTVRGSISTIAIYKDENLSILKEKRCVSLYNDGFFDVLEYIKVSEQCYLVVSYNDDAMNNVKVGIPTKKNRIIRFEEQVNKIDKKLSDSLIVEAVGESLEQVNEIVGYINYDGSIGSSQSGYNIGIYKTVKNSNIKIKGKTNGNVLVWALYADASLSSLIKPGTRINWSDDGVTIDENIVIDNENVYLAVTEWWTSEIKVFNLLTEEKNMNDVNKELVRLDNEIEKLKNGTTTTTTTTIITLGDSLTVGAGGNGITYPKELQKLVGDKYMVVSSAVGGENCDTISGRIGAIPYVIKEDFILPSDGSKVKIEITNYFDKVVKPLVQGGSTQINPCIVDGMECTMTCVQENYGSTKYELYLQRNISSLDSRKIISGTPIITNYSRLYNSPSIAVIWIGTNDTGISGESLSDYVKKIVSFFNVNKFVVIGKHGYDKPSVLAGVEDIMQREFGSKFINWRKYASVHGCEDMGITPSEEDIERMNNGYVPSSLMSSDLIHLNGDGYKLVASLIYKRMIELNYI